jgi:hypothetical protein
MITYSRKRNDVISDPTKFIGVHFFFIKILLHTGRRDQKTEPEHTD